MAHPTECRCVVPAIKIGGEDICPICGVKRTKKQPTKPIAQPKPAAAPTDPRSHVEQVINRSFAAVSDRGKSHATNQDFVTIAETDAGGNAAQVMVICDGVSSSQHAEESSKRGAIAASESLVRLLKARVDVKDAIRLSIVVADRALRKLPLDPNSALHPPGATIVVAAYSRGWLTVGWIGDSRCYWIDKSGARLLTHDHSWVNMMVASGAISQSVAEKQPDAHRISRCIGPIFENKSSEEQPIEVCHMRVLPPGVVLLCTDGLWNYITKPETLAKLIAFGHGAPDALTLARSVVSFANKQGGKDNITVALLAVN